MKEIHKFTLLFGYDSKIWIPSKYKILSIDVQHGTPVLWAIVDTDSEMVHIEIKCYGTGWDIAEPTNSLEYIGTVQNNGYVWHYFKHYMSFV